MVSYAERIHMRCRPREVRQLTQEECWKNELQDMLRMCPEDFSEYRKELLRLEGKDLDAAEFIERHGLSYLSVRNPEQTICLIDQAREDDLRSAMTLQMNYVHSRARYFAAMRSADVYIKQEYSGMERNVLRDRLLESHVFMHAFMSAQMKYPLAVVQPGDLVA